MENILEIAKNIGTFIAGCAVAYITCRNELNKFFNKKQSHVSDNLEKQSKLDANIIDRLEYTKEILGADVIHVYEFHNDSHYSDGRSAMKLSCTYEALRAGVDSIRKNCQQIPIACIPKFVNKIIDDGKYFCDDVEKLSESAPATYGLKKANNIACFADIAIRNKKGKVIGLVAVLWLYDNKRYNPDEHEIQKLAYFIEEALSNMI